MVWVVGKVDADADGAERRPHGVTIHKKLLICARCVEVDGDGAHGSRDARNESVIFLVHIPERQVGEYACEPVLPWRHRPEVFSRRIHSKSVFNV